MTIPSSSAKPKSTVPKSQPSRSSERQALPSKTSTEPSKKRSQTAGLVTSNHVFQEPNGNEEHGLRPQNTGTSTSTTNRSAAKSRDAILAKHYKNIEQSDTSDTDVNVDESDVCSQEPKNLAIIFKVNKSTCPCSDSTGGKSWILVCTGCSQTWHANCANLRNVASVVEIEDWKCPWCYVCQYVSPTPRPKAKPAPVSNAVRQLLQKIDTDLSTLTNSHRVTSLSNDDLFSQIRDLQTQLKEFKTLPQTDSISTTSLNKLHNELMSSIGFELKELSDKREALFKDDIAAMKQSLSDLLANQSAASTTQKICNAPKDREPCTPHAAPVQHSFRTCDPFTHHSKDFLDLDSKNAVELFLNSNLEKFSNATTLKRKLMYFGEFNYAYSGTSHKASEIPAPIQNVINKIHEKFPSAQKVNSCLVTLYENGSQYCPPHSDDEPFIGPLSDIYTMSIGATRTMRFNNLDTLSTNKEIDVPLTDGDLLVFSRSSQDSWKHSITPDADIHMPRFSLTFRALAPYNLNSCAIIGDSNTQDLVFGTSKGTLGKWLPGIRIKAPRIHRIPEPQLIGPFRNFVLHVGINDLMPDQRNKTIDQLREIYENKCRAIMGMYPKSKIYVSMLLPTKDRQLNVEVNKLNCALSDMCKNYVNMFTIQHLNMTQFGVLDRTLGRYHKSGPLKGQPQDHDLVHLGASGIKRFVLNIKAYVIKSKNSSQPRTTGVPQQPQNTRHPIGSRMPHPSHPHSLMLPNRLFAIPQPLSLFPPRGSLPSSLYGGNYTNALNGRPNKRYDGFH